MDASTTGVHTLSNISRAVQFLIDKVTWIGRAAVKQAALGQKAVQPRPCALAQDKVLFQAGAALYGEN